MGLLEGIEGVPNANGIGVSGRASNFLLGLLFGDDVKSRQLGKLPIIYCVHSPVHRKHAPSYSLLS